MAISFRFGIALFCPHSRIAVKSGADTQRETAGLSLPSLKQQILWGNMLL
jgi:hypothetical protein